MKISQLIVIKRWEPILEEYEKIRNKVLPRPFRLIKDLCLAHHISNKELRRYYRKWQEGKKQDDSLLPAKIGVRPGFRRTPKAIERNIMKTYRRFGSNRYELVLLFKPYYLDKTPSPATMDRIKRRYPLNESQKKIIKRYEQVTPGELPHIDLTKIPKDLRTVFKIKDLYVATLLDDYTRLTYLEILKDKKSSTLTCPMVWALSWFKQIYTRPYRPQTNSKVEAFWKIIKNEFFYPHSFDSVKDLIYNLGNFLFEYNHLRRHGGLE